jgi:hypothetical protein
MPRRVNGARRALPPERVVEELRRERQYEQELLEARVEWHREQARLAPMRAMLDFAVHERFARGTSTRVTNPDIEESGNAS